MPFFNLDPQNIGKFSAHTGKVNLILRHEGLLHFVNIDFHQGTSSQRTEPVVDPVRREHTVGVKTNR